MNENARRYWNAKLPRWAASCYGQENVAGTSAPADAPGASDKDVIGLGTDGVFSKQMSRWRSSVDARLETATALLTPVVAGRTVLDLGCGTGDLSLRLAKAGAAKVEAVDIADAGVAVTQARAQQEGLADKISVRRGDVGEDEFPAVDIACGLGLLDWITLEQVDGLFGRLKCKWMLFSFSDKNGSLAELAHRFYLVYRLKKSGLGVGAHHFPLADMKGILARRGFPHATITKNKAMRFGTIVHALPPGTERVLA